MIRSDNIRLIYPRIFTVNGRYLGSGAPSDKWHCLSIDRAVNAQLKNYKFKWVEFRLLTEELKVHRGRFRTYFVSVGQFEALLRMPAPQLKRQSSNYLANPTGWRCSFVNRHLVLRDTDCRCWRPFHTTIMTGWCVCSRKFEIFAFCVKILIPGQQLEFFFDSGHK